MTEKETIDYEINQDFLAKVRESLDNDESLRNIVVMPRNDDASIYASTEEEPYLLSFSN